MSDEIFYATIRELGARYRKREISPVEVTRALLARIEKLDPLLHAFVTLTADRALEDARTAEAAIRRGDENPLLGIPVAHKDIYLTRGIRTTGGSALFAEWIPDSDSTVVRRWQEAGTVLLGKLIHTASIAAYRGGSHILTPYSASKAGVVSLTRSAAQALAPQRITSNCVCPGAVETPMWEQIDHEWGALEGVGEGEMWKRRIRGIPLGRPERPEDVANVIAFLAGPDSDYMTGQALIVDGGMVMGN